MYVNKTNFASAVQAGQQAAAPVAAPAVSVFAKAKNLLSSVAVNSRTAKIAIGSIVTAAIVYAGFKFATASTKKAETDKKEQKTTDRVILKMQEAKAAVGKAYRQISASATKFNSEHPVATKVIAAVTVAGTIGVVAKLLYKPAQVDPVDYTFDNINAGDGSDSRCEEHGAINPNAAPFSEGDSELVPEDYDRDHLTPGMEFDARASNAANQARMESFYAPVKTPAPVPALHTAAVKRKIEQEANALAKDYAPDFTSNEGLDDILDAQAQGTAEMAKAMDEQYIRDIVASLSV